MEAAGGGRSGRFPRSGARWVGLDEGGSVEAGRGVRCGPPWAGDGGRRPRPAMADWEIGERGDGEEEEE